MDRMKSLLDVRDQIVRNHEENRGRLNVINVTSRVSSPKTDFACINLLITEGRLCQKDLQNLKNWTYVLSPQYEDRLSTQGKDDLRLLGQRIRSQYPSIFDTYSSDKYVVSKYYFRPMNHSSAVIAELESKLYNFNTSY